MSTSWQMLAHAVYHEPRLDSDGAERAKRELRAALQADRDAAPTPENIARLFPPLTVADAIAARRGQPAHNRGGNQRSTPHMRTKGKKRTE